MKDIGIIGLPSAGKSTLFTALTQVGAPGGRKGQAVVDVPDPRLEVLARLEQSRRVVPARVRFVDVPGGLTAQGIGEFRGMDALCLVLRAFGPNPEPAQDLVKLREELVLQDMAAFENGLERARKRARADKQQRGQLEALEHALRVLDSGRLLREGDLEEHELDALRGYAPLTLKPWIIVANVGEGQEMPPGLPQGTIPISAGIEKEVAELDEEDRAALLREYGIEEPSLPRVIRAGYSALDLITFFTTGEDETRAWEVRRGAKAPEAAGAIHSDLERGFIRAEVVHYDQLVAAGSWEKARRQGLVRVEGKDYVVQEGDVLHIRFSV